MKYNSSIKWLSVLMTIILFLTIPTNVQAQQVRSHPYFLAYGINMTTTSEGHLYMSFTVTAKDVVEMIGVSFYRVQRRVNGNWSNVTDYIEGHLDMNDVTSQMARRYTEAVSGVQYRVYARLYIRDYDGTVSTIDYYSQSYTLE